MIHSTVHQLITVSLNKTFPPRHHPPPPQRQTVKQVWPWKGPFSAPPFPKQVLNQLPLPHTTLKKGPQRNKKREKEKRSRPEGKKKEEKERRKQDKRREKIDRKRQSSNRLLQVDQGELRLLYRAQRRKSKQSWNRQNNIHRTTVSDISKAIHITLVHTTYTLSYFSFQPVVRAFAHGAMGRRIDPSWGWTHWAISCSSQCSTKAVVCVILSVGWWI